MFDKGVAYPTINSGTCVVVTLLNFPSYRSIDEQPLVIKNIYIVGIFNLRPSNHN